MVKSPDTLPCATPPDKVLIRRRIPCSEDARPGAQVASEYASLDQAFAISVLAIAVRTSAVAQSSAPQLTLYGTVDATVQLLDGASVRRGCSPAACRNRDRACAAQRISVVG